MKKLLSMVAAGVMSLAMSQAADASVTVNVDGHDWQVSTIEGTYADIENDPTTPSFSDQPWWTGSDDRVLARAFADAVGEVLGLPNSTFLSGPLFIFEPFRGAACSQVFDNPSNCGSATGVVTADFSGSTNLSLTFAVASKVAAIPLPAGGLLLLAGLAAAGIGYRRKVAVHPLTPPTFGVSRPGGPLTEPKVMECVSE